VRRPSAAVLLLAAVACTARMPLPATAQATAQARAQDRAQVTAAGRAEPDPRPRPASPDPASPAPADAPAAPDPRAAALFAMPAVAAGGRAAAAALDDGNPEAAAAIVGDLARAHPEAAPVALMQAGLALERADPDAALDALGRAADLGADIGGALADPRLAAAAGDPRATALRARPAPPPSPGPVPAPVTEGTAPVSAANTAWNPDAERLVARFAFPEKAAGPVLPAGPKTAALEIVREHWKRGRAAGNRGDLYDNRDRGHSSLKPEDFPQLAHVQYDAAARAADLDYGLADRMLFEAPTLANSSTAITAGALWRSLPRAAMTAPDGTGPLRLWQNASLNQLAVYPGHRDFTPDKGDLFPANTPYLLVSRGSSGSDQPFLEAAALILAAFRPDTKARLVREDLVVPTLQMVFRRSLRTVTSREDYLGGPGNPAAFAGADINAARMVSLANAIKADAIPPQVRLAVLEEDLGAPGTDYFGEGLSETLFDTPAAIARVWRDRAGRRSILVSAGETRDPNGRKLAFEWRLLQGDTGRVRIEPLGDGSTARITLDWHDPFPISEADPTVTARIDVGVFASNGVHDSAPAILSWYCPPTEKRSYAPADGGPPRLVAIDHAATDRADAYADPLLVPRADWRDAFETDAGGRITGWTRSRPGREPEAFTADGRRILDRDAAGRPTLVEAVAYPLGRDALGRLTVAELSTGEHLDYQAADPGP